jgi:hypothetical protein
MPGVSIAKPVSVPLPGTLPIQGRNKGSQKRAIFVLSKLFSTMRSSIINHTRSAETKKRPANGGKMAEDLQIHVELTKDLLARLSGKGKQGRETAIEALAISTEDEDWRPNELIRQGGIEIIRNQLGEKNPHIVLSALAIIIAIAATGEEEALISDGVIACLDTLQDSRNPAIQKKVREALSLLEPEVEDVITSKPEDDDYIP